MTYEELTAEELLQEYRNAVENLPGSGAAGRAWLADVTEEMLERLKAYDE